MQKHYFTRKESSIPTLLVFDSGFDMEKANILSNYFFNNFNHSSVYTNRLPME